MLVKYEVRYVMPMNNKNTNYKYRWIGLAGIILLIVGNWLDLTTNVSFIDPISRLLFLIFSVKYWLTHKGSFSVILLICASIIFLLGIATLMQIYVTSNLL